MIINKQLLLTYLYLLIYICLSSGVILYNKVSPFNQSVLLFRFEERTSFDFGSVYCFLYACVASVLRMDC